MIAISESILKIHKDNKRALAFAADAYAEKKMEDKQIEALTRLISLDPNNTRLQTQVVNILAASGKASLALPIVDDAVKNNPGDASLVHLQWLVHFAAKDIKGALGIGEEMVKLDTASADTTFFIRQAARTPRTASSRRPPKRSLVGVRSSRTTCPFLRPTCSCSFRPGRPRRPSKWRRAS